MEAEKLSQFFGKEINDDIIEKLGPEQKRYLATTAKALADVMDLWNMRAPPTQFLKSVQRVLNLKISDEFLSLIEQEDAFEIWSLDGQFLASSLDFYRLTTWSLDELLMVPREKLFFREEKYLSQANESIGKVIAGAPWVADPCDVHYVREQKDDGIAVKVQMRYVAPVFNAESNGLVGVLAIVRFSPLLQ